MNSFKEISPFELQGNHVHKIGRDWMLVSAADGTDGDVFGENYNTMTASWGGVGVLWNKPVAYVFIRPERHTFTFTEESDFMSLSFFGGEKRDVLTMCGRTSGRDTDKVGKGGLTPVFAEADGGRHVYFEEASEVLLLRKMYAAPIETSAFTDQAPLEFYRTDGLHRMYVCEIVKALVK